MSESTEPASSQPQAQDVHWALYLRDDLRDIRNEFRGLHTRIDEARTETIGESRSVRAIIDEARIETSSEFRVVRAIMDEARTETSNEFRGVHTRIDEAKAETSSEIRTLHSRLDSHFRWMMTTMIAMTGVIAALVKL